MDAFAKFISTVPGAENIFVPFSRVANILKQAKEKGITGWNFNEDLFKEDAEKALFDVLKKIETTAKQFIAEQDYSGFLNNLPEIKLPVDEFFDGVLVMCPEEDLRNNRLALLDRLNNLFLLYADFSYIRDEDIKNVRKI